MVPQIFATPQTQGDSRLVADSSGLKASGFGDLIRIDGSGDVPLFRTDAANSFVPYAQTQTRNDGLFGQQQLTYIESRVAEQPLPPLTASQAFSINSSAGWADRILQYSYEQFGEAALICCANDFPMVSIDGREISTPSITIGAAINMCYADLQKANFAGLDIGVRMMAAVRRAILQKANDYAWYGDTASQIMGVGNNPLLGLLASPVMLDNWNADPYLLLAILNNAANQAYVQSGMALPKPNTVAIAPSLAASMGTRMLGQFQSVSVWEMFLKQSGITKVIEVPQLECLSNGQRTTFLYNRDVDSVEWNVPVPMEVLPAVNNGYGYTVNVVARVNSLWFKYPRSAVKLVG